MSFEYTGAYAVPGQHAKIETFENQFWWDRFENQIWTGLVIDGASRDAGNTSYTTVLRPGLLLGRVTATDKIKEWNPTASDGTEQIYAVLGSSLNSQRLGANQDRFLGNMMVGGFLKADRLLNPGSTTLGIDGNASEFLIRAQLFPRFQTSDWHWGTRNGGWRNILAITGDKTLTDADSDVLFTTRGAATDVEFTLPANPYKGLRFGFYCVTDNGLKVTAGTADTMVVFNDATADSIDFTTAGDQIGAMVEVVGDGTGWLVIPHTFADGVMVQTVTLAT